MTFLPWKKKTEEKNAQEVSGVPSTDPLDTIYAQHVGERYAHLSFMNGKQYSLDRWDWPEEALYKYLKGVLSVIVYIGFSNNKFESFLKEEVTKVYEAPVLSRIPGGYNARPVTIANFRDSKFVEALKRNTTTFYIPEHGIFACTLDDKRKLLAWLRSESRYSEMVIFWPGQYQSHAFHVRRRAGLMTRIMELLGPSEADKASAVRMEALRKVRQLRVELNELQSTLAGNKFNDTYEDNWDGYR